MYSQLGVLCHLTNKCDAIEYNVRKLIQMFDIIKYLLFVFNRFTASGAHWDRQRDVRLYNMQIYAAAAAFVQNSMYAQHTPIVLFVWCSILNAHFVVWMSSPRLGTRLNHAIFWSASPQPFSTANRKKPFNNCFCECSICSIKSLSCYAPLRWHNSKCLRA